MKTINVNLDKSRSYKIFLDSNILDRIDDIVRNNNINIKGKTVIVTNSKIANLYSNKIISSLKNNRLETEIISVKEGETSKSLAELENICSKLINLNADRRTTLIALGGGVIGDLTGFTASSYMRGIPYIQVPTSLLAMVDSSVGGKTGVNLKEGKNLVGAFYQPKAVIIDIDTLNTLPKNELIAGLAEVIKYGIIEDEYFFKYLESNIFNIISLKKEHLIKIISTSCSVKAKVVEKDELESNYRAVLNFGHTIGHAIEALTSYERYKHGEALSIGMVYAALLSEKLDLCKMDDCKRLMNLLKKAGLPVNMPDLNSNDIINCIYHDKKSYNKNIKFILMRQIGKVEIADNIQPDKLKDVLNIKL